jgi:hypothetical protein
LVVVPAHRKALTGLYLRDHNLSVERLRYSTWYKDKVLRKYRLCRFYRGAVEDEVHALFGCTSQARLVDLRTRFLADLANRDPTTRATHASSAHYAFLLRLVASRKAVQLFARYAFDMLNVFNESPGFFPVVYRVPG